MVVAVAKKEAGSRLTAGMGGAARAEEMCLPGSLWRQRTEPRTPRLGEILSLCRGLRQQGRKLGLWQWAWAQSQWNRPDGRTLSGRRRGHDHWQGEYVGDPAEERGWRTDGEEIVCSLIYLPL